MPGATARVARASRIYVEGIHDAELVEHVWGDDLRIEGVVVEYLGGVDDLADHLRDFGPGPQRRVGVLVDHLVPGSKESLIAQAIDDDSGSDTTTTTSTSSTSTSSTSSTTSTSTTTTAAPTTAPPTTAPPTTAPPTTAPPTTEAPAETTVPPPAEAEPAA